MKEFISKYKVALVVFPLFIIGVFYTEYTNYRVKKNGVYTIGFANKYQTSSNGGAILRYYYSVNNHVYKNMVTTNRKSKVQSKR